MKYLRNCRQLLNTVTLVLTLPINVIHSLTLTILTHFGVVLYGMCVIVWLHDPIEILKITILDNSGKVWLIRTRVYIVMI